MYVDILMPDAQESKRRRTLLTFKPMELDLLIQEATRKGLRLATYLKSLITSHPERARGATKA